MCNALATGVYIILRKCSGYRLEHIFSDNFHSSQYFAILNFIGKEFNTGKKNKEGSIADIIEKKKKHMGSR